MKSACFRFAIFNDCDMKGANIEATDFDCATLIDTDLRAAKVVSFSIKGANLEKAFGGFLEYTIKNLKEHGPNAVNSMEVVGIHQLFQKATRNDDTNLSDAVREALLIMMQSDRRVG